MSRVQKINKLSGNLYGLVEALNGSVTDGDFVEALSMIGNIYDILGELEQRVQDEFDLHFC